MSLGVIILHDKSIQIFDILRRSLAYVGLSSIAPNLGKCQVDAERGVLVL